MYFFSMDVENKITKKNSIYARIWVHRNIAESLKWLAESSFLYENLPNTSISLLYFVRIHTHSFVGDLFVECSEQRPKMTGKLVWVWDITKDRRSIVITHYKSSSICQCPIDWWNPKRSEIFLWFFLSSFCMLKFQKLYGR